ncbi:MAG: hypothetical protein GY851_11625, partial [bacterium]|nr:hypothetical protein [bacterium]
ETTDAMLAKLEEDILPKVREILLNQIDEQVSVVLEEADEELTARGIQRRRDRDFLLQE